jgi:hypothetical protein
VPSSGPWGPLWESTIEVEGDGQVWQVGRWTDEFIGIELDGHEKGGADDGGSFHHRSKGSLDCDSFAL